MPTSPRAIPRPLSPNTAARAAAAKARTRHCSISRSPTWQRRRRPALRPPRRPSPLRHCPASKLMRHIHAWPIASLLAVCIVAACSKDKAIDEPARLTPLKSPSLKVQHVWEAHVDDKKAAVLRLGLGVAIDGNRVYAAGHRGDVVALDLQNGHVVWRAKTRAPLSGGTAASPDLVLIGASDGQLFAFNPANGQPRWKVRLNGEVLAAPTISAHLVAVRTGDGKLHALSPA